MGCIVNLPQTIQTWTLQVSTNQGAHVGMLGCMRFSGCQVLWPDLYPWVIGSTSLVKPLSPMGGIVVLPQMTWTRTLQASTHQGATMCVLGCMGFEASHVLWPDLYPWNSSNLVVESTKSYGRHSGSSPNDMNPDSTSIYSSRGICGYSQMDVNRHIIATGPRYVPWKQEVDGVHESTKSWSKHSESLLQHTNLESMVIYSSRGICGYAQMDVNRHIRATVPWYVPWLQEVDGVHESTKSWSKHSESLLQHTNLESMVIY